MSFPENNRDLSMGVGEWT